MITGSLVALVTPMHNNGDVDWSALKSLVEWHIAQGSQHPLRFLDGTSHLNQVWAMLA